MAPRYYYAKRNHALSGESQLQGKAEMDHIPPGGALQRTTVDTGASPDEAWVDEGLKLLRAGDNALVEFCKTPPSLATLELLVRKTLVVAKAAGVNFDADAFLTNCANRQRAEIAKLLPSTRAAMAAHDASQYGITRARARQILDQASPWKPKSTAPLSEQVCSTAQSSRTPRTSRTRTTVAASASGSSSGPAQPSGPHPRGHDRASESDPTPAGRIRHQHQWVVPGVSTAPAGSLLSFKAVAS